MQEHNYGKDFALTAFQVSFIAVAINSRDQYKIIGLRKISHFTKLPCRNICMEKAL